MLGDVDVSLPAPERPVDTAVLRECDHDVVSAQAYGLRPLGNVSIQRALLLIAAASQERYFDDTGVRRSLNAPKGWVDNHVSGREAGEQLEEVASWNAASLDKAVLNGCSQGAHEFRCEVARSADASQRQGVFLGSGQDLRAGQLDAECCQHRASRPVYPELGAQVGSSGCPGGEGSGNCGVPPSLNG